MSNVIVHVEIIMHVINSREEIFKFIVLGECLRSNFIFQEVNRKHIRHMDANLESVYDASAFVLPKIVRYIKSSLPIRLKQSAYL